MSTGKGHGFFIFPTVAFASAAPVAGTTSLGALETCLEVTGNHFSCEVPGKALLV